MSARRAIETARVALSTSRLTVRWMFGCRRSSSVSAAPSSGITTGSGYEPGHRGAAFDGVLRQLR